MGSSTAAFRDSDSVLDQTVRLTIDMSTVTLWISLFLVIGTSVLCKEEDKDTAKYLTRVTDADTEKGEVDIKLLLVGQPLVGVVDDSEDQLLHFGILPQEHKFPDILLYLEATDPDSEVEIYCLPYQRMIHGHPPDRINSDWKSSKDGDMFISAKSMSYQESMVDRQKDGKAVKVAAFGCAVRSMSGGPSKYQLTVRLSFDERQLRPTQEMVMKDIFKSCCSGHSCHRWLLKEQNLDDTATGDQVEFDFCHRMGSMCNTEGELLRLDLRAYGLKCKMPIQSLLKLTTLQSLDMSFNSIHADIADDIGKFGDLKHLKDLVLARNLIFGDVSIHGLCPKLLGKLRTLDLEDNHITGRLPSCLFTENPSLEEIYLSRNSLHGYISDVLPTDSSLKAVSLSDCGLTGPLPPSLSKLRKLKVLYLDGNSFSGQIPNAFNGMENLQVLDMSNNRLSHLPSSWSSSWNPPQSLRVLKLQNNRLRGGLPARLLKAKSLEWLDMSHNSLSGKLFSRNGMFPKLTHFNISRNQLSGHIPSDFSSMGVFSNVHLSGPSHVFDISFNNLTGALPDFMYQEATPDIEHTDIYLEGNKFTCHPWRTLNYIPNFECENTDKSDDEKEVTDLLLSERHQRDVISAMKNGDHPDSEKSAVQLQSSNKKSKEDDKADAIVAAVASFLGLVVISAVIGLIVKYKRNRDRRLGLQYGAPDDIDSDEPIDGHPMNGDAGPSWEPKTDEAGEREEA